MTDADKFTLRLMLLECFQAQELNGDEIYIKLNDQVIWTWERSRTRFSHDVSRPDVIDRLDFAGARQRGGQGWQSVHELDPNAFVFSDLSGTAILELWDADTLTRDDLFGRTPIRLLDAGRGDIAVLFQDQGARYRLTYQVMRDEEVGDEG